ncbi:MAG: hypothetical protein Q9159_000080 [Coniocarpon cinnabarinum]
MPIEEQPGRIQSPWAAQPSAAFVALSAATVAAPSRKLSASPFPLKKSASAARNAPTESPGNTPPTDPQDFRTLRQGIANAQSRLREDLSKLRGGGKLNPEVVESLRVKLDKGATIERLSQIAQVVPRGRTLQVIASEKEHMKPISSAILSSELGLAPQSDAQNSLQLNMNLPPPTTEARQRAVLAAQKLADGANDAVRNARGAHQKVLRAMEKARSARPDDVKKAGDEMEKIVAAGNAEVRRIADTAKKALEGG